MPASLILRICLMFGPALVFASIVWSIKSKAYTSLSWLAWVISVAPGVVMAGMFYSLAIHMHAALGGWPECIGEAGFPPSLIRHADLTFMYFEMMILAILVAWPISAGICFANPTLRRFLPHLSIFAIAFFICFGLMLLAPSQFLYWWWD